MPFNLWSGTDYTKTVTTEREGENNFACDLGINVISSSIEWSSNGDRSYKLNLNYKNYAEYHCFTFDLGKDHMGCFDVYCGTGVIALVFVAVNWSDRSLDFTKSVNIPKGINYTVSATILSSELSTHDELRLRIRAYHNDAVVYVDNWRLIEM